jgi:soluble lytic murein transglycosylase-like protein
LILPEEVSAAEEEAAPEPEPVLTETMAEVYIAQGHVDEALDIYRKLLAQQPGNAALAAKVAEIEAKSATAPAAAAAPGGTSVSVVLAEILGVEPRPAMAPPPRPEGARPPAPSPAARTPPAGPPAQAADADEFSFDQFFGAEEDTGGAAPSTRRAAGKEGSEDDFRNWLKSLKT